MAAWTFGGRVSGLPVSLLPWGVRWRRDAFTAAGIPPPASDWTYDDFRSAGARVQALAASGHLKGLGSALGPIALPLPGSPHTVAPGLIEGPKGGVFAPALVLGTGLWQGFVWGFGGSVAHRGRFFLTAPQTVAALQQLVDLAREYSVPARYMSALPTDTPPAAWDAAVRSLFAMEFAPYNSGYPLPAGWAWARLPRFPVEPVVPTQSTAVAVEASKPGGAPPAPDAPETLAAARFGVWLDSAAGIAVTAPRGLAPALAAPSIQTTFWTGRSLDGAAALGDWHQFRGVYDGFPAVLSRDYVAQALSDAMAGTANLADALAGAEKRMNAELLPSSPGSAQR